MPAARTLARTLSGALLALGLAAAPAAGGDPDGAEIFRTACAGCHGAAARGDGPLAGLLLRPVPDLTRLAAGAGGAFPRWRVIHAVDGRSGLRAHGGPMPVFGHILTGDRVLVEEPGGGVSAVSARVLAVVDFLAAIQEP